MPATTTLCFRAGPSLSLVGREDLYPPCGEAWCAFWIGKTVSLIGLSLRWPCLQAAQASRRCTVSPRRRCSAYCSRTRSGCAVDHFRNAMASPVAPRTYTSEMKFHTSSCSLRNSRRYLAQLEFLDLA